MNRLIDNLFLSLRHPRQALLRVTRGLPLRVQTEIVDLEATGLFKGITHLVDAGAHHGVYAESVLRVQPDIAIWCFEPAPDAYRLLKQRFEGNPRVVCFEQAIGASDGKVILNVSGIDQANSIRKMCKAHTDAWENSGQVRQQEVALVRLGSHLQSLPSDARVFLKIDVQGAEKDVILGCGAQLEMVQVVLVELSLIPLYEGSPLLPEMVQMMDQLGFHLFDVVDRVLTPSRQPVQLDCVFVRKARG